MIGAGQRPVAQTSRPACRSAISGSSRISVVANPISVQTSESRRPRTPEPGLECAREVAAVLKSAGDADGRYRRAGVAQQFGCLFEADTEITLSHRLAQM